MSLLISAGPPLSLTHLARTSSATVSLIDLKPQASKNLPGTLLPGLGCYTSFVPIGTTVKILLAQKVLWMSFFWFGEIC
ncbi:hypothetical protein BT96DRAFT_473756 [Gymnopus androsaceus JB14]|uniref:Uncharacterized protein n=1 Tax=Gymnopus androsaceus JB14 TaxID=1447944 RepID=A0A6A4HZY3_9AGAR|nr:hypothetical protein BT96DRAFT_473756 [Gymnopus androsaceus JB14]